MSSIGGCGSCRPGASTQAKPPMRRLCASATRKSTRSPTAHSGTYFPSPGFCDEAMNFFLLTELRDRRPGEAATHQDPDELLTVKEFAVADVRTMIRAGEIVDMKTIVGLTLISTNV
jgi:hypothetical protein